MNTNEASEPDVIVVEMLSVLNNLEMNKITEIGHKIYDGGEILEDLSRSVCIGTLKKTDENEYELYYNISSISHIMKLIIKILQNSAYSRIILEIEQGQFK